MVYKVLTEFVMGVWHKVLPLSHILLVASPLSVKAQLLDENQKLILYIVGGLLGAAILLTCLVGFCYFMKERRETQAKANASVLAKTSVMKPRELGEQAPGEAMELTEPTVKLSKHAMSPQAERGRQIIQKLSSNEFISTQKKSLIRSSKSRAQSLWRMTVREVLEHDVIHEHNDEDSEDSSDTQSKELQAASERPSTQASSVVTDLTKKHKKGRRTAITAMSDAVMLVLQRGLKNIVGPEKDLTVEYSRSDISVTAHDPTAQTTLSPGKSQLCKEKSPISEEPIVSLRGLGSEPGQKSSLLTATKNISKSKKNEKVQKAKKQKEKVAKKKKNKDKG